MNTHSHYKRVKMGENSARRSKCVKGRDTLRVWGTSKWAVTSLNSGLCRPHTPWAFIFLTTLENGGHPPALSQEFNGSSSAPSRHTDFQITSGKRPHLTYQTQAAPTEPRTLPLPACQRQRRRGSRHVPQVAPAPHAPARFPLLQKSGRKRQGTPYFPPNTGKGKQRRTGKPACKEREKGSEPSH